jgi:hypothetical protein
MAKYTVSVGGRGWPPPGVEANGYTEGNRNAAGPQGVVFGRSRRRRRGPGDRRVWFQPNVWPAEVPPS